jgi:hypothetical protein
VLGAWTNNGRSGPENKLSLWVRLTTVGMGAMGGFVLALVGFFVWGGIREKAGEHVSGESFLWALVVGAVVGAILGLVYEMRPTPTLTLFVGADGCAQIQRRAKSAKTELLSFGDVRGIRTHVSIVTYSGIRTATREFHVTDANGKERLWYLSAAPGEPRAEGDPQYAFGEAVLRAFAAFEQRRRS